MTTGGFAVSDLFCQTIEFQYKKKSADDEHNNYKPFVWDRSRTLKFTIIGCLFGFQFHYWIPFVAGLVPGNGGKVALKRVIIDQVIMFVGKLLCIRDEIIVGR